MKQVPVRNDDRKVFDELRRKERRGLADQFGVLLDVYCRTKRLDRKTGKPLAAPKQAAVA
jgi:hypothetical protein